jgi:hypothetical protein
MATSEPSVSNLPSNEVPAAKPAMPARPVVKKPPTDAPEPSMKSLLPAEGEQDPDEPQQEEPAFHHAAGFFNQPWVQNVLPLATSLFFHVAIITVGILFFSFVPKFINPNKEQVIIPESKSIEKNAIPGGIEHPGLDNDKTRDAAQDLIKNSDDSGFSTSAAKDMSAPGGGIGADDASAFEGGSPSNGRGTSGAGGAGSAFGTGTGGGTAPWGVPGGGGGLLPKSAFFGTGGNATKVIYLCDKSGSMLSVFGALKQNLKESINALDVTAGQEFNICFFSDEGADALFKDGMHIASADNKKLAMDYIDNEVASGGTLPLPAINFCIAEKPELLYVLTDGFDQIPSFDDVTKAFKAANANMHINCIFLQSDPDPKLEEFLKAIATQGHGDFKAIQKSDM